MPAQQKGAMTALIYQTAPADSCLTCIMCRESYQMTAQQKGVMVRAVSPVADAAKHLKPDDVIMKFDGVQVASDGTVPFRCTAFQRLFPAQMLKPDQVACASTARWSPPTALSPSGALPGWCTSQVCDQSAATACNVHACHAVV